MSDNVRELVEKIQQFFSHQLESNTELSDAAKESLSVASECIEQAYRIQRKPASNELLEIYQRSRASSNSSNQSSINGANNPAQLIQNLASSILSSACASATTNQAGPQSNPTSQTQSNQQQSAPSAPKVRKQATEAERLAAESFKNQGNDLMKQDKFKEALDSYTRAIEIDDNNAIYYSNRAAASSKLGDHQSALRDCQEAVEIDSTYSKAYGRMGLAYASLDDHMRAKEAYVKAVELDPHNESYRNNLKIAEEQLEAGSNSGAGAGAGGPNVMVNMIRSMMGQPEVVQMAMRSLQDPRMQNLLGFGGQAANGAQQGNQQPQTPPTATTNSANVQNSANPQQAQQQQQGQATNNSENGSSTAPGINPADLLNLAGSANIDLVGAGQQLLSTLRESNPNLINDMRRMMSQAFMPPGNNQQNDADRNPPPGYS